MGHAAVHDAHRQGIYQYVCVFMYVYIYIYKYICLKM